MRCLSVRAVITNTLGPIVLAPTPMPLSGLGAFVVRGQVSLGEREPVTESTYTTCHLARRIDFATLVFNSLKRLSTLSM